jgi:hypothetical protein
MLTLQNLLNKYTAPPYNRTPEEIERQWKDWHQLGQKASTIKKRQNKWEREAQRSGLRKSKA